MAGALGGALLLGVAGARSVPPPPPLVKAHPHRVTPKPEAPAEVEPAPAQEDPDVGPALIWLLPMAGQLSSAPAASE